MFVVGWKPIGPIVLTFWAEESIFPEKVRQNAADPDQIRYTWTDQGVTTFRNFKRDRPILAKTGTGTSLPRSPSFFLFGKPRDLSGTSQRPIFTKFGHET